MGEGGRGKLPKTRKLHENENERIGPWKPWDVYNIQQKFKKIWENGQNHEIMIFRNLDSSVLHLSCLVISTPREYIYYTMSHVAVSQIYRHARSALPPALPALPALRHVYFQPIVFVVPTYVIIYASSLALADYFLYEEVEISRTNSYRKSHQKKEWS